MLVTAIGLVGVVVPIAVFYVAVGPTAHDRLIALALGVGAALLGLYSLWESKSAVLVSRRPDRRDREP
jgi:multisubunit Na+/H+ antiporter MnhF subunit